LILAINVETVPVERRLSRSAMPLQLARRGLGDYAWIWIATVALFAVSGWAAPGSVAPGALRAMAPFAGMLAIVAVGQTLVIQQRGIDMSAVGAIALAGVLVSSWGFEGRSLTLAILGTLGVGALAGAANGYLVTRLNITPIVATLATNALMIGAVRQISHGAPLTAPPALRDFAVARLGGLPYMLFVALLLVVLVAAATGVTIHGKRFVAVGVNPRAARAAGVAPERYQVGAYVIASVCFFVTGILLAGFIGNASPMSGADYLLPGVAAVVVGGTPFTGGQGSVIASGVAAVFMTQLGQLVLSLGAPPAVQLLVQALAIVFATGLRSLAAALRTRRAGGG
jgi:ribose transport system permease protein